MSVIPDILLVGSSYLMFGWSAPIIGELSLSWTRNTFLNRLGNTIDDKLGRAFSRANEGDILPQPRIRHRVRDALYERVRGCSVERMARTYLGPISERVSKYAERVLPEKKECPEDDTRAIWKLPFGMKLPKWMVLIYAVTAIPYVSTVIPFFVEQGQKMAEFYGIGDESVGTLIGGAYVGLSFTKSEFVIGKIFQATKGYAPWQTMYRHFADGVFNNVVRATNIPIHALYGIAATYLTLGLKHII
jgi:hypothetical protein